MEDKESRGQLGADFEKSDDRKKKKKEQHVLPSLTGLY